ncbi:hypothetical protein H7U19_16570 [Hyunsoonleella sp. SJ7]|uniref:Uncharacterized protein n=1 Tax=Hyunsoonleella aquatilis TaxID=2762758 RepID=A0A923KHA0_9FLAO|nr:DUF6090 family protein [Hyunsoonleella aquatilis]MBC3760026.1 hypothetical protein [Hyunsoonleella aquatilis]MBC3760028.1 hypothetical protein [Hyunsoonleella aquatilis]
MIKFFRKIRQKMLTENRFGKYLIYAIGEIILVVIGILIALQINNRNELIKTNSKQKTYLSLIKNEMENNLNSLKEERIILSKVILNQQIVLELMQNEFSRDTISENQLSKILVNAISNDISVNYENGVLTELIVSGNLKDIKNDSIRSKLSSWESKIYKIREQENSLSTYWDKSNDFFELNGKFRTLFDQTTYSDYVEIERLPVNESNKKVLNSTEFENILLIKLASSMHLEKGVYPKYKSELVELIDLIDKEIN